MTDVTNASRTLLMNLSTLTWDNELLQFFNLPHSILPQIKPSSGKKKKQERYLFIGVKRKICGGQFTKLF